MIEMFGNESMKRFLLLSTLLFPTAVAAEPLWAYVTSAYGFVNISVDLNSIKTLGDVTYYNERWKFESGSVSNSTQQLKCASKRKLFNQAFPEDTHWGYWPNASADFHTVVSEFVCDAARR